jgi:DNA-binding MarR family transcriptional regulator/N-acetylglutamate synthase-like GNAT family acetyltransferase
MDLFGELQELALASRLSRLSDRLMEDAGHLYDDLGVEFQPRWFTTVQALSRRSPLAITELARALGLTHTAAGYLAGELVRAGLAKEVRDPRDDRRRLLRLSPRGEQVRARLEPVWAEVRRAVRELLAASGVDLLEDLRRVEEAHAQRSIMDRVRARLDLPARQRLVIVDYRPAYKKHFRALNEAWLLPAYCLEPHDARLLNDPNQQIIRRGGRILFALMDGQVAGTCALVPYRNGEIELCKMAVGEALRGQGSGTALARAAIGRAGAMDGRRLFLQTHARALRVQRFYRRLGFRVARSFSLPRPAYARPSITMALDLAPRGRVTAEGR